MNPLHGDGYQSGAFNASLLNLFGSELRVDPSIALPEVDATVPFKSGPLHKVQFVVEFVGPRSIPAPAAVHLLGPEWYQALGHPAIFCMRASDLHWQILTKSTDGSYDSLAISWDLMHDQGFMSTSSAAHLFQTAERFAPFIQRRALALPVPNDVPLVIQNLMIIQEELDIGFALIVEAPAKGFRESDIWILCTRLGLKFGSLGAFEWLAPSVSRCLLEITPIGDSTAFSLANVQAKVTHEGLTIGFRLAWCPAPAQALQASFYIGRMLVRELGGRLTDQDQRTITPKIEEEYRSQLKTALTLFAKAGIVTGSTEALKLFR